MRGEVTHNSEGIFPFFVEEIRKSAGNAGIKTFTSKLDQGLITDAIAKGEVTTNILLSIN